MEIKQKLFEILKENKPFNEGIQKKVGRDRAIVYGVYLLGEYEIEPTFQRICVTCFKLFPESFSFVEFPEYPDSRVVRNCIWHCVHASKGWLVGSDKTKYSVTEKGKDDVIPIFKKLIDSNMDIDSLPYFLKMRGVTKRELVTKPVDKEGNIIQEIKQSKGFELFKGNKEEIRSVDIKQSIGGDRYVSEVFLNKKLKEAFEACELINDKEVKSYLEWIKENWSNFVR